MFAIAFPGLSSTTNETLMIQKATVYDLEKIMEKENKETYTYQEIIALMDAYIQGAEQ